VSSETPLISNLDICENISLIREVHHHLPIDRSRIEAMEMLQAIGLEGLCDKRAVECSPLEIFFVMVIRAMMSDFTHIYILTPFSMVKKLGNLADVLKTIALIGTTKEIVILDISKNIHHYKECECNIIT